MRSVPTIFVLAALAGCAQTPVIPEFNSAQFLTPTLVVGEQVSQVFSRTVATSAPGIDQIVKRISGSGTYRLTAVHPERYSFEEVFLYDGRPSAEGLGQIKRDGSESCWQNECTVATDASGLLFNSLLWGTPPGSIRIGTTWHTTIGVAWELGPPGEQEVTVVALDAPAGTVTLSRHGQGQGAFDHDPKQLKVTQNSKEILLDVEPGLATWSGYTIITRGVVIADELLVQRTLKLSSSELGTTGATQRQYILLNKAPNSTG